MSNPIQPWASATLYPATPAAKWAGTPTKVNPAYQALTPGQTPSAQVLNAMFYNRDVALAGVAATSCEDAAANWNAGITTAAAQSTGLAFDHKLGRWLSASWNGAATALYESVDGSTWTSTTPTNLDTAKQPAGVCAFPATGTVCVPQWNGTTTFSMARIPPPTGTGGGFVTQPWGTRAGATCNQGAFAYFYGAATPAMYYFGTSGQGGTGSWVGFCASDTPANDGAGTAGVWTDLHTSLPASFASGTGFVAKFDIAQSSTTMVVAMCGGQCGPTGAVHGQSFLMSINAAGTMTDITPGFLGTANAIRGLAYSANDGLWGMLVCPSAGLPGTSNSPSQLYVSADLVNWTQVATLPGLALGLAVMRNLWVASYVDVVTGASQGSGAGGRVALFSTLLAAFNANTQVTGNMRLAAYQDPSNETTGLVWSANLLLSTEVPGGLNQVQQFASASLLSNSSAGASLVLSKRAGHFDALQTGATLLSATAAGWQTALDVDFSKQPNQTIGADGAVTIGSFPYSWTKVRSAQDRAALAVVNGSGLVFQPLAAASNGGGLFLPLVAFLPANLLLWSTGFRVWVYLQGQNFTNNGDQFQAGLVFGSGGTNMLPGGIIGKDGTGTPAFLEAQTIGSSGPTNSKQHLSGGFTAVTQVMVVETPALDGSEARYLCGQYNSGAWPTEAAGLTAVASAVCGTVQIIDPTSVAIVPASVGLILWPSTGIASALTVTIGRVRVDYKL